MEAKSILFSKTFWVNILTLIAAILGYCVGIPWMAPIVAVVLPILNIILRILTVVPVSLK